MARNNKNHRRKAARRVREFTKAQAKTTGPMFYGSHPPNPQANRRPTETHMECQTPIYISQVDGATWSLDSRDSEFHPELSHLDGFQFTVSERRDPADSLYRAIAQAHIPMDSLAECSKAGHPRQAWASILEPRREPTPCPVCQRTPDFVEFGGTFSVRGFDEDVVEEEVDDLFIEHAVVESIEDGNLFFRFESHGA